MNTILCYLLLSAIQYKNKNSLFKENDLEKVSFDAICGDYSVQSEAISKLKNKNIVWYVNPTEQSCKKICENFQKLRAKDFINISLSSKCIPIATFYFNGTKVNFQLSWVLNSKKANENICIPVPKNTMRFKFSNISYEPPTQLTGTWTKVKEYTKENVWDYTTYSNSGYFGSRFSDIFDDSNNKVELIACGDLSAYTNMSYLFKECSSLLSATVTNCDNVETMQNMFGRCSSLKEVTINMKSVKNCLAMFEYCSSLKRVNVVNVPKLEEVNYMFVGCSSLEEAPCLDLSDITEMYSMFLNCYNLKNVPLYNTSNVKIMSQTFMNCSSLKEAPNFNTHNVTTFLNMFNGCSSLTRVPLYDTSSCTEMIQMFMNCVNVESGALALYERASSQENPPSSPYYCFTNCGSNTETGVQELSQIPQMWGGTKYN